MNAETQQNPYAPPEARVSDFVETAGPAEPASRWIRLGAVVLDGVLYTVAVSPLLVVSLARGYDPARLSAELVSTAGIISMLLLAVLLFMTLVLVHRYGQTIGKRMLGIRVVRSDGSRATLGRIFWLRNFVNGLPSAIPFVGNFYFFVDSLFIFGPRRQCLHDLIADTIVVRA